MVRLAHREPVKALQYILLTVPRRNFCGSFVLFMSCVCHAFASVYSALRSPEGKGLASLLLFVMFIVILGQVWY